MQLSTEKIRKGTVSKCNYFFSYINLLVEIVIVGWISRIEIEKSYFFVIELVLMRQKRVFYDEVLRFLRLECLKSYSKPRDMFVFLIFM